jgi:hypothetical protein
MHNGLALTLVNVNNNEVKRVADEPEPVAKKSRAPSMHDVARLAGVSHQTVSRVINDAPNIRDETKQRVLDSMEQLQYGPPARWSPPDPEPSASCLRRARTTAPPPVSRRSKTRRTRPATR